jgi:hypothetical protein
MGLGLRQQRRSLAGADFDVDCAAASEKMRKINPAVEGLKRYGNLRIFL